MLEAKKGSRQLKRTNIYIYIFKKNTKLKFLANFVIFMIVHGLELVSVLTINSG